MMKNNIYPMYLYKDHVIEMIRNGERLYNKEELLCPCGKSDIYLGEVNSDEELYNIVSSNYDVETLDFLEIDILKEVAFLKECQEAGYYTYMLRRKRKENDND